MRRDRGEENPGRDPWRGGTEIAAPLGMRERGERQRHDEKRRPVFRQHRGGGGQSGKRRPAEMARVERAQHRPHGERPERDQYRVLIEFQPEEIVERDDGEQERHSRELLAREPFGAKFDRQKNPRRHRDDREQDVGPVGEREDLEPCPQNVGEQRRVLRVAERKLARPHHHFAHVGIEVLARLRDHAVDEPERAVGQHECERGAPPPRRIGEPVDDAQQRAVEPIADAEKAAFKSLEPRGEDVIGLWHGPPGASIRIEMRPRVAYHHPQ